MRLQIKPTKRLLLIQELNARDFPSNPIDPEDKPTFFLAKLNGVVVGWCGVILLDSDRAEIYRTGVSPEYRNQGIKKKMVRAMERWAKAQGCVIMQSYCSTDNMSSANSLISSGYKLYIPDHYDEGSHRDWLTWKKRLDK